MAIKLGATGITFPDNTVQTTAAAGGGVTSLNGQTGAIDNTTLYAIGSYTVGRPLNTTDYPVNSTIAGTSLYSTSHDAVLQVNENGSYNAPFNGGGVYDGRAAATLVNIGSWRALSGARTSDGAGIKWAQGLWVRYA